jgi:NAD kinase
VGGEVVADQVHVELGGDGFVDRDEEFLELDRPVLAVGLGDHGAVCDVERGEQARDAMPGVVVAAPLGHARHHRQHRLGTVQACI